MARSRTPKFDASEVITNEIIRIIERGVLPWRKPWTAGGSSRPLRVGGEPYQGVNNFLLTMRTVMAGHSSPFWMTLPQANALDAKVRKGEKSSVVVYYGQSRRDAGDEHVHSDGDDHSEEARIFRFQKSYRVFNACQIEGLPDSFYPDPEPVPEHPPSEPIPHMQAFFDAIDITTVFTGTEAYYLPPVDKVGGTFRVILKDACDTFAIVQNCGNCEDFDAMQPYRVPLDALMEIDDRRAA